MTRQEDFNPPVPDALTYIVGDIHGCGEQLQRLLEKIDKDHVACGPAERRIVFVGDYIDRGDESAAILEFLHALSIEEPELLTCLTGNHEAMLLDFLDDPLGKARKWLRYGGMQTLASYGVPVPGSPDHLGAAELIDVAAALRSAMGGALVTWLKELPLTWRSGNLWVVHAGADPSAPMEAQERRTLLWGHDDFFETPRQDGQWVAVGHRHFDKPFARAGRMAVDTGAVYGGPLSAARITPEGETSFLRSR